MISVISPIYNEAENLEELYQRVVAALESRQEEFEFLLVENGSTDDSLAIIKTLCEQDARIRYVSLSRNFGHQGAISAGLAYASGDAVICLDGDLQHPPELLPKMIALWKEGYDVIYTLKIQKMAQFNTRLFLTKMFYRVISAVSELKLSYGQSDFRLLDRKVVDVLNRIDEKDKFLRGLVQWVGFRQTGIEYDPPPRKRGESKFSIRNYIAFALDGIFSFSTLPLRISLWAGMIIAFVFGMLAIVHVIIGLMYYVYGDTITLPPGWLTITISIFFLGGIQLISIGLLGEYLGRVFLQTKARPDFIVKEKNLLT